MSINNTQPGYPATDSFIENNGNVSTIGQLLSVEVIPTSQPSLSVTFNPINMIPTQTSLLSNMPQQNNLLSNHQQQSQAIREEQQRIHREQQEQRRQRRRQNEAPGEHRYIGYRLRLYARDPKRYQQELDETEHQAYSQRRSPTFHEMADEILQERQLEDYDLGRMTPQERHEIWEPKYLNQLQGNHVPQIHRLPLDNSEQYADFLQEPLRADQHDQAMRVYDIQNDDYAEECRKNEELLMQKEQWEDRAFRHQHLQ